MDHRTAAEYAALQQTIRHAARRTIHVRAAAEDAGDAPTAAAMQHAAHALRRIADALTRHRDRHPPTP